MKNPRIISALIIILIVSASTYIYSSSSSNNLGQEKGIESIIIVRAYEHGWVKSLRGIYICYGKGQIEKIELEDDLDPITNADRLASTLNEVSQKGYRFFGSYRQSGAGIHSANYFTEYVFKKPN